MIKKVLIGIGVLLVIIQFIHPTPNKSTDHSKDITNVLEVPEEVQKVLRTSCYDCHSNNTTYLWYDNVQPVRWWVEHHIKEGKRELNFSEFATYNTEKQLKKINDIGEVIDNDEMPLKAYTLMHKNAILSEAQKEMIVNWANDTYDLLDSQDSSEE